MQSGWLKLRYKQTRNKTNISFMLKIHEICIVAEDM